MVTLSELVARNARAQRAAQQRRQVDVAAAAGLSRTALSELESGSRRITIDHVHALCVGLGVGVRDLLAGADRRVLDELGL